MTFPEHPICPNCKESMESGYIVSMTGIHWSPDEKAGQLFVPNMKTDVMYPENEGAFLQNARYIAGRCKRCGLALLGYKE